MLRDMNISCLTVLGVASAQEACRDLPEFKPGPRVGCWGNDCFFWGVPKIDHASMLDVYEIICKSIHILYMLIIYI